MAMGSNLYSKQMNGIIICNDIVYQGYMCLLTLYSCSFFMLGSYHTESSLIW